MKFMFMFALFPVTLGVCFCCRSDKAIGVPAGLSLGFQQAATRVIILK